MTAGPHGTTFTGLPQYRGACTGIDIMAWKKPRVTEVSVAMEINCYACAEA
ncbi:pyrroloquinoline quinone precursor peptide PqqA [Roseomonas sp. CECT 9278]|uniref:pyrroloquinoline quinone precursor peptide PqqA n=1 Tax=Roseomonas sp. CECT 9278 TaxID=2845823 RepID=UPI001E3A92E3|nr:pyrroloquinoline quinone precursor peptide PqqA [Roseomonas sp. CECT 9278]CAH0301210.1 Coenzyme PQQ synthesis protein A [Roseomonas sp. CECT 9278]